MITDGLRMFSGNLLRALRPCAAFQPPVHARVTSARCVWHLSGEATRTDRSFLRVRPTSGAPSSRCFSRDGKLIYTGSLGTTVRAVKTFSYTTSAASLILVPQILLKTGIGVDNLALQVAFCGTLAFLTFVTPTMLHLATKGYVIRLYHNVRTDMYTAVTCSLFLTEKISKFHQTDVSVPPIGKMFTTFYGGKMALMVNPDTFPVPQDYNHLMGYDKPFEFDPEDVDRPKDRS